MMMMMMMMMMLKYKKVKKVIKIIIIIIILKINEVIINKTLYIIYLDIYTVRCIYLSTLYIKSCCITSSLIFNIFIIINYQVLKKVLFHILIYPYSYLLICSFLFTSFYSYDVGLVLIKATGKKRGRIICQESLLVKDWKDYLIKKRSLKRL